MTKRFKAKPFLILLIMLTVKGTGLMAQVSINGPGCIIPGLTYQYVINGNSGDTSAIQVCITGGTLSTNEACTLTGSVVSSVFVTWHDTSFRKLDVISSSGNASLTVRGTTGLKGGQINDNDKMKVYNSAITSYTFHCAAASGGSCNPVYVYQWQISNNGLNWINMEGATGKNFHFMGTVQVNTYFRRVTTEISSQTVAYSDNGLLTIVFSE